MSDSLGYQEESEQAKAEAEALAIAGIADREALRDDCISCFLSNPRGTRVLAWLRRRFFQARPTFVAGSTDLTAFREGQRYVVLSIFEMLETDDIEFEQEVRKQGETHE